MKKITCYLALSLAGLAPATSARRLSLPKLTPSVKQLDFYHRRLAASLLEVQGPYLVLMMISSLFKKEGDLTHKNRTVRGKFPTWQSELVELIGVLIIIALQVYPKQEGFGKYLAEMKLVDEKGAVPAHGKVVLRAFIKIFLCEIVFAVGGRERPEAVNDALFPLRVILFLAMIEMYLIKGKSLWGDLTGTRVVMNEEKQGKELSLRGK